MKYTCLPLASALLGLAFTAFAAPADPFERDFVAPPDSARPGVYWYFMDGNLNGEEMLKDLESMKEVGLGILLPSGLPGPVRITVQGPTAVAGMATISNVRTRLNSTWGAKR